MPHIILPVIHVMNKGWIVLINGIICQVHTSISVILIIWPFILIRCQPSQSFFVDENI